MNDFWIWFSTGVGHITDLNGYDHILFVSLLFFAFPLSEWKKILILITAFTIGHSVSLALSVSDTIFVPQPWIEFLIALSILVSAIHHLVKLKAETKNKAWPLYIIVLLFGLIHGMGFSFLLKAMLGKEQTIILPLLYFNLGLELGQLIIVEVLVVFSLFLTRVIKINLSQFKFIIVCIITLVALKMSVERLLLFV